MALPDGVMAAAAAALETWQRDEVVVAIDGADRVAVDARIADDPANGMAPGLVASQAAEG
jgi:hypothetical protein